MPHGVVNADELTLLVDMARTQESVFAVDSSCRIVYLNSGVESLLGYRARDVIGCRCCEALHFADANGLGACSRCTHALATSSGLPSSRRFVVTATAQSGQRVRMRVLALPAYNASAQLRIVHVLRAISPKEPVEEDEALTLEELADVPLHPDYECVPTSDMPTVHTQHRHQPHVLTKRELEVLKLLAGGLSTANIATTLSISPLTARNHVTSIIEKLGAKTRLQAVVTASHLGLLLNEKL